MKNANRFNFQWATPEDEPDIRALVGSVPMPGAVSIRFAREPDYFLGTTIMGDPCDVLVVRHQLDGQLAGIACRAERQAYLNGQEAPLGYIGQIRVAESFRGNWLVHRGAKWFRDASPPDLLYTGVISSENPRARELLVGARLPGGLHVAGRWGMTTCAIPLRARRVLRVPGVDVRPASLETLDEITAYLRLQGSRRQFFPSYRLEDFSGGIKLRGLRPEDIFVARRGDTIVGVMASWDQAAYKQDIIDSYGQKVGDRMLKKLSEILSHIIREADYIYRYNNEQFVIMMPHTLCQNGISLAERIRQRVARHVFTAKRQGYRLSVTLSMGVSEFDIEDTVTAFLIRVEKAVLKTGATGINLIISLCNSDLESDQTNTSSQQAPSSA